MADAFYLDAINELDVDAWADLSAKLEGDAPTDRLRIHVKCDSGCSPRAPGGFVVAFTIACTRTANRLL